MTVPIIHARIEQRYDFPRFWIRGGSARFFSQGTRDTSQSEIILFGFATIDPGNYVVDVECCLLAYLGKLAVFTSPIRPAHNQVAQTPGYGIHSLGFLLWALCARSCNSVSNSLRSTSPSASRRSAADSFPSSLCRSNNSWSRRFTARGRRNFRKSPGISRSITTRDINLPCLRVGLVSCYSNSRITRPWLTIGTGRPSGV